MMAMPDSESTAGLLLEPNDPRPATPVFPWETLSDAELLKWRIGDLGIRLEGSAVAPRVERLYEELQARGLVFRPPCYLSTEWLCPDRVPAIGIPFCLAHPRLKHLEQSMMLEVEGGSEPACLKLLRHECGHAINYAYRLYRRSRWRELFGPFSAEYDVQQYYPRPYSRQFVVHLEDNYAQAHPDEDFAETFAVWLTPNLDWREKYREWGALRKLEYVDHLMGQIGSTPPPVKTRRRLWPVDQMRSTLESYYRKKRHEFAEAYPGFYDADLFRLFTTENGADRPPAAAFLARHRAALVGGVAAGAHVRKYAVDQLARRLGRRARELGLRLRGSEEEARVAVSIYLTAQVCEDRQRYRARRTHR
jgi:hypothetical protein